MPNQNKNTQSRDLKCSTFSKPKAHKVEKKSTVASVTATLAMAVTKNDPDKTQTAVNAILSEKNFLP